MWQEIKIRHVDKHITHGRGISALPAHRISVAGSAREDNQIENSLCIGLNG